MRRLVCNCWERDLAKELKFFLFPKRPCRKTTGGLGCGGGASPVVHSMWASCTAAWSDDEDDAEGGVLLTAGDSVRRLKALQKVRLSSLPCTIVT
jgi:hypothetical protein